MTFRRFQRRTPFRGYGVRRSSNPIPSALSGAAHWWDTTRPSVDMALETIGDDLHIAAWADRIGGLVPLQATPASMFRLDGLDVVMDGSDDFMSLTTSALQFMAYGRTGASDWCAYELINPTSASTTRNCTLCAHGGEVTAYTRGRLLATNTWSAQMAGVVATSNTSITTGQWYWSYYGIDGATFKSRIKGGSEQSGAAGAMSHDFHTLDIGQRIGLQRAHQRARDAIIFPFWPSAGQHSDIQGWADARMAA